MKKFKKFSALLLILLLLSGCANNVIDENEVIDGNGTDTIVKNGVTYTIENGEIFSDGVPLASLENSTSDTLFAMGNYLYANTEDGAMQISLKNGKVKKFGSGEIIAAKGIWIYYTSDKSEPRGMSLYKIDMTGGKQYTLIQGETVTSVSEDGDTFTFTTESGKTYQNTLSSDTATEKTNENETEKPTE